MYHYMLFKNVLPSLVIVVKNFASGSLDSPRYNIEGEITDCWLVETEGIFS